MRIGVVQEAYFPPGSSLGERYEAMVEEAVAIERAGFDFYCLSEQHFGYGEKIAAGRAGKHHSQKSGAVSAPEVFLPYIGARTERMSLRTTSTVLLPFNNPVRVAERVATLDVLTNGRAELGTARSNNLSTLTTFGIHPRETKAMWRDSLEVIVKAFTQDDFTHDGPYWQFAEPVTLTPKSVQRPHPRLYVSCSSSASHGDAGALGIGAMTGGSIVGWQYVEEAAQAYRENILDPTPLPGTAVNDSLGFFATRVHCAPTREEAFAEAAATALAFIDINIGPGGRYDQLAPTSPDYAYLGNIREMQEHLDDLDYIMERTPYVMIGTPEFLIRQLQRIKSFGYNELLLGIEGMEHDVNMRAIEMLGRDVLPALR
jgi:alkanesulfonate monooxygenase SsuD/methylene tetrahydromethanopterin reductase-like flavin-dependent oxidoreductase (luciferase family)